jgi:hypothetical protein
MRTRLNVLNPDCLEHISKGPMAEIPIQADVLCTSVPRLRYFPGRRPDFNNPLVAVLPTVASPQQVAP